MLNVKTFVVVGVIVAAIIGVGTVMGQDDSVCVTGGAVPTGSAGLISDCETLLGVKSALRGTAKLNWWSGRSIEKWDGITVENGRVVGVSLPNRSLNGVIPTGFGSLSALKTLDLSGNSLTGTIPASLNNLTALTKWRLAGNGLSGCVPYNFAQVSDNDLASLGLSTCGGSGPAPTAVPTTVPTAVPQTHSRIVFDSYRDGNWEIYVMNPDGSGQTRLTDNPAYDREPSWSPDGRRIVFDSGRDGNGEIYVMNADGSDQIRLTDNPAVDGSPSWSPDGHGIVFDSNRDENYNIYVMNADGSDQTRLTDNSARDFSPSWSPDGRRIAFASHRDGSRDIYVMNADGSGQTRLTDNSAWDGSPSWSPNGRRIVFTSNRDGNNEIYVMNTDGSGQTRLTDNPAIDSSPSWSPDGCRIVFESNRDDPDPNDRITIYNIYVMNVCETRLTNNSGSNRVPSWSVQGVATPTPTVTPTATSTPVPTTTPTATSTPVPTATPTATSTPVPTATPTATSTPVPLPPPPSDLGLDPFYKKYLDAGGLPIVASDKVPDEALFQAREIIDEMLANGPDIRAELIELRRRVTVVSDDEVITDIPEFRDLYEEYPGTDWNPRVQGGGLSGNIVHRTTAIWEGNLLCNENNVFPREDILVHEFAHAILNMGVEQQPRGGEFRRRLEEAYRKALDAGLWGQTYAGENSEEYWAEGVQSWFGLNDRSWPANGVHNQIDTRHELEAYDPRIADLIEEVFGDTSVSSTCHTAAASVDPGQEATIEFLGDVSPAKRAEVRALVADLRNFFDDYAAGKSAPEPLFVVSYDQEMLRGRFKEIEGYEHAGPICGVRSVSLYISLEPVCGRPAVFAHEYFHYLQGATAPGHLLPNYGEGYSTQGPWWLTEGAAVYNSLSYTVARGIESYHVERDRMIRKAAQSTSSLADLELAQDFFNDSGAYEVGFLAVEWLARHSSDASILRYYELLLQHDTWQAAFENAFGITVDEFYESFEEHRSSILPTRYRIAGVVLGPAGEPLEGIGIWAWQGEADNSGFDRTGPGGEFDISVPDGSFTLDIYAAGPGCSFVGWYDGNSITASYDEAVRVTVDGESVGGIEIRLPAHPDDLPRVAWCS